MLRNPDTERSTGRWVLAGAARRRAGRRRDAGRFVREPRATRDVRARLVVAGAGRRARTHPARGPLVARARRGGGVLRARGLDRDRHDARRRTRAGADRGRPDAWASPARCWWSAGRSAGATGTWRRASSRLRLSIICILAFASRLLPSLLPSAVEEAGIDTRRLSYPLNYWNAVGVWAAMTVSMALAWSAHAARWWVRGLALAAVCVAVPVVYMTYSRTAAIVTSSPR